MEASGLYNRVPVYQLVGGNLVERVEWMATDVDFITREQEAITVVDPVYAAR